ncbi:hypothetical protein FRC10_001192 [Ceratobasidium sp. 414]|nr:hypothetical protein FRC10_001192 [Ceratobasidium sp. 414]
MYMPMADTQDGDAAAAAAALAQAQVQAADAKPRLLNNPGPAGDVFKRLLDFGIAVTEVLPTAEPVFALCNTAWQKLEAQAQCDECVESLVDGLSSIHPLVAIVEKAAKLPHLQSTIRVLFRLIEDASRFIIEYHSEAGIGTFAWIEDAHRLIQST